jgi:hypothetical protein
MIEFTEGVLEIEEKKIKAKKCCFCKKNLQNYGNNAEPVMKGLCCDCCNKSVVIPLRLLKTLKASMLINQNIQDSSEKEQSKEETKDETKN